MAAVYGIAGALAGLINFNLQAASQAPAFIISFSILLALLGIAMLGLFPIQPPRVIRQWLDTVGRKQQAGSMRGAAVLGTISALMVGPCTAPPVLAALAFANISQQPALAGAALFCMGLGLGAPLLLIGLSAGKLLPKAGPWMTHIKAIFGVAPIALAPWFSQRLLPDTAVMLSWAFLLLITAIALGALEPVSQTGIWPRIRKGPGIRLLVHAITLLIGAAQGNRNLLHPLTPTTTPTTKTGLTFYPVQNVTDLRNKISAADGSPIMLDYRADWCTVCRQLEAETFTDPRVQQARQPTPRLQVDTTIYDHNARSLLAEYILHGPPAILFFINKQEQPNARIYEFMDADTFIQHLKSNAL